MKKNWLKLSFVLIFVAAIFLPTAFVQAQTTTGCQSFQNLFNISGSNITTGSNVNTTNPTSQVHVFCSAGEIFTFVLNLLFEFTGAVAIIFIILGGFWFMTSAGNEERAEKGRKTLINSIIGLVVIILAATIVRIVVNTITSGSSGGNNPTSNSTSPSTPSTSNPVQPVSTTPTDAAGIIQSLSYLVELSANPPVAGVPFTISVNMASSDYTKLQAACNGQPLVQLNLGTVTTANFTNQNNGYLANFNFGGSDLPSGNYTAQFSICSVSVPSLTKSFTVASTFGN